MQLAETIALAPTPARSIPLLEAGATLPIERTETLTTSRDDQETLPLNIVQGTTPLTRLEFPIQKRGPRGIIKITLTLRVSLSGELSLSLIEQGTSNVLDRGGLAVLIR